MTARRWVLGWVLFALVCAQALGLVHRVTHLPAAAAASVATASADAGHLPAQARADWVHALFAHEDEFGCRLFDGVGQCGAPLVAPLASLPLLPAAAPLPSERDDFVQRWTSPFLARGPPAPR